MELYQLQLMGHNQPSHSPYGSPDLYVWIMDGSLRMCVDAWVFDDRTVRDRSPSSRIDELFEGLRGASIFLYSFCLRGATIFLLV